MENQREVRWERVSVVACMCGVKFIEKEADIAFILKAIVKGLMYIHDMKVVHRYTYLSLQLEHPFKILYLTSSFLLKEI
jgi:hypothetical protein